ncbi:MAG: alpha-ketoglutarate-dependent dioxygenase AlkB family protein [Bacteroidia bacterium]
MDSQAREVAEGFFYFQNFLNKPEADVLLHVFLEELNWQQSPILMFGKMVMQPRLTAWYGDLGKAYTYSGVRNEPLPWHPDLLVLRELLMIKVKRNFNSVLANRYRSGEDSMGWHSDDEKELGENPVIASISLGEERMFHVRKKDASGDTLKLKLEHGSLLLMKGNAQEHYQHALPKTKIRNNERINLTFRTIKG